MPTTVEVVSQAEYASHLELISGQDERGASQLTLGRETWDRVCAKCHGSPGEGDLGPPVAQNGTLVNADALTELLENGSTSGCRGLHAAGRPRLARVPGAGADRVHPVESNVWRRRRRPLRKVKADGCPHRDRDPDVARRPRDELADDARHKRIGILYIVTAFAFFFAAGVMALLMRAQLAQANNDFITENSYNQLFTVHGTMIFLFVVPILAGFGNYLVPLMIGARDMAFPRLNAPLVLALPPRRARHPLELPRGRGRRELRLDRLHAARREFSPGSGQDL